ncbi:MAG: S8 family serine peptidase [Aulosira sp. DedQUE10]|nr:S8 family serine peptidase [Aulosira sp. DedQUE10]
MSDRVVIVRADSKILQFPNTERLHTYTNGDVLIRTNAPEEESAGESEVIPVQLGVKLPGIQAETFKYSQPKLLAGNDREIITVYVELIGPVAPEWLQTLRDLGIEPLQYHPENSYLCRGTVEAFRQAQEQSFVWRITPATDSTKPQTPVPETGEIPVWIVVQGTQAQAAEIIRELNALPDVEIYPEQEIEQIGFYLRLRGLVTAEGQSYLLLHRLVMAVEPYIAPKPEDEVAGLIIAGEYNASYQPQGSYLRWLEDHNLNGQGVTIGIVDNGVDVTHPAFSGRIADLGDGTKSWHGTFVAGHAAGCYLSEKDGNQFIYGLGMAPAANLLVQSNSRPAAILCRETVTQKAPNGVAGCIQNNSWGAGTRNPMDYSSQEAAYDQLVRNADPESNIPKPLTICFSSGNSGAAGLTRPKAAKNIIVTGNSENYRPDVGKDQSDNIQEVYSGPRASSYGNCGDSRIRPHIVAPGEWTASANYDSRSGQKEYISQQLTWGGGSSGASPKTAGACALLIQWWQQHNGGKEPSPAMLRALVVNGAEALASGGFIPNKIQGWGRLNLNNILAEDVEHTYSDQTVMLKRRGEVQTWQIWVTDSKQPVKITLAWTDPPGAIGSGTPDISCIVNKLALRVEVDGKLYRGNQFQHGWSYPDGTAEREAWDNLQNIYLPAGEAKQTIKVSVMALDITTNCLTGKIDTPQQDFALVITNGREDKNSPSGTVFVGVDNQAQSQPQPDKPDDFWTAEPGNHDRRDRQVDWWQNINTKAGNEQSNNIKPSQPKDVDAWWLAGAAKVARSQPETEQNSGLLDDANFVAALQAGANLVQTVGNHQVVISNKEQGKEKADSFDSFLPEVNQSESPISISGCLRRGQNYNRTELANEDNNSLSFAETLANLKLDWEESDNQRRIAVLVVGAGTRISLTDLEILRMLTFQGKLYLLSDYPPVLAFLAQRIHRQLGIEFRLAESAESLATLVQETITEASGLQKVDVKQSSVDDSSLVKRFAFQVVNADKNLTLRIQLSPNQQPSQIELYRPQQNPILLVAGNDYIDMTVEADNNSALQINIAAPSKTDDFITWAGEWEIKISQSINEELTDVAVWALSELEFTSHKQPTPISETKRDRTENLVVISNESGVSFSRLQSQPQIISTSSISSEADREIDVTVEASRLELETTEILPEASSELLSPSLSTFVSVPPASTGAVIVDLPMHLEGVDANGDRYARNFRMNLIQLQPRSALRESLEPEKLIFTPAEITEINYADDEIVSLLLSKSEYQRLVAVVSPILRQQLAEISQDFISKKKLIFGVIGSELYGLVKLL